MKQHRYSTIAIATVLVFAIGEAKAQNLPWCAIMDNDGTTQCAYYTQQQCLQTLSGIGGECILNPAGTTTQSAPAPSSGNEPGLLPLQLQNPGPPPGLGASPKN
ncbi:MAG TPA: DUF3551 domain-containing protein [Pseudolabrys sp.]|nr:DUF3551 domain-containing protein [Pseudolabrys sp.]